MIQYVDFLGKYIAHKDRRYINPSDVTNAIDEVRKIPFIKDIRVIEFTPKGVRTMFHVEKTEV